MNSTFNNDFIVPNWWKKQKGELLDIFQNFQKLGSCSCVIVENQISPKGEGQIFPDSWFIDKYSNIVLPTLEITGLEALNKKGTGQGRLCLQALYKLSRRKGCGGRLQVIASFGAGTFYEHCGFQGPQNGADGIKYFDPTPQSLALLFPNSVELENIKFIPSSIPLSKKNNDYDPLLKEMLQRAKRKA